MIVRLVTVTVMGSGSNCPNNILYFHIFRKNCIIDVLTAKDDNVKHVNIISLLMLSLLYEQIHGLCLMIVCVCVTEDSKTGICALPASLENLWTSLCNICLKISFDVLLYMHYREIKPRFS